MGKGIYKVMVKKDDINEYMHGRISGIIAAWADPANQLATEQVTINNVDWWVLSIHTTRILFWQIKNIIETCYPGKCKYFVTG